MSKRLSSSSRSALGFTLIEAIVAIVIAGIAVAMVGLFIRTPIQTYFDTAARAGITDAADTALRRIGRDLRLALPNSLRSGGSQCIEYLPTNTGGRYRAECSGDNCESANENKLDFSTAVTKFDVIGGLNPIPVAGDRVVVYNLGIEEATAYSSANMATIASVTTSGSGTTINLTVAKRFPFASPGNRFQVVPNSEQAVSYVCTNPGTVSGEGTGTLYRYSAYGINPIDPATCPTVPNGTPIMLTGVSACSFTYTPGVTARSGLVTIRLAVTRNNETATLIHEVHVNNVP